MARSWVWLVVVIGLEYLLLVGKGSQDAFAVLWQGSFQQSMYRDIHIRVRFYLYVYTNIHRNICTYAYLTKSPRIRCS